MTRLALTALVPFDYDRSRFTDIVQKTQDQVNQLSEGRLRARHFNATSIPTTGSFAQGDVVWKSNPVEAGTAGSKYVILGYVCTVAGTPGTLLEMRVLTGN